MLLVEDEDVVAALTKAILATEKRIEVIGRARNGIEAIALAGQLLPDLVLMDINMPELDGIEATRRIRAHQLHVQVLIVSASTLAGEIGRSQSAGAAGFVAKDRMTRELIDAILALFPP